MQNTLTIPTDYLIWQQDLTTPRLELNYMGKCRTKPEAFNMVRVLSETDPQVRVGKHSYFITVITKDIKEAQYNG